MDTPSNEVPESELAGDLEATQEEAETVKGGFDIYKFRKEHKRRNHRR
jgi:hypothetical protein